MGKEENMDCSRYYKMEISSSWNCFNSLPSYFWTKEDILTSGIIPGNSRFQDVTFNPFDFSSEVSSSKFLLRITYFSLKVNVKKKAGNKLTSKILVL